MKKTMFAAAAAGAVLIYAAGAAAASSASGSPFDQMVVIGDSLSDDGNLSLAAGYPQPMRFTTNPGQVAVEGVAAHYGLTLAPYVLGGTDLAFGGAGINNNSPGTPANVPTLTNQVNLLLAAHPSLDSQGLYTFWGGANDIFYHATLVGGGYEAPTAGITAVSAAGVQAGVLLDRLQSAGAGTIVVFNLPDVGRTPQAHAQEAVAPGAALLLTGMTLGYNGALDAAMSGRHGVVPVNVYAYFNEVLENPAAFGLTNVTTPACTVSSSLNCTAATLVDPNAASTYLFADGVHPTTAGHKALADLVISELNAPQQMSLLAEAPLALTSTSSLAVQDEMMQRFDAPGHGLHLFASGGYANGRTSAQLGDIASTDGDAYSVTAGASMALGDNLSGGLALTAGRNRVDWGSDLGHFDVDGVMLSVFAQYAVGSAGYINVQGQGGQLSFDVRRDLTIGDYHRSETSDPDGWTAGARVGAGFWFGGDSLRTGPFVSGEYQTIHVDSFDEHGSDSTAMTFSSQRRDALVGKVGWAVKGLMDTGGTAVRPYLSVAYAYDDKADRRYVTAGLVTLNGDFDMPGYLPEKDWVEVGAGLSAEFNARWGAQVGYNGHFADDDRRVHTVSVGLHAAF